MAKGPNVEKIVDIKSLNKEFLNQPNMERKLVLRGALAKVMNSDPEFAGKLELRQKRFTMFHNGTPVDEITFVNAVLTALANNKAPAEEGLFLQEFDTLPGSLKAAWTNSGFKETKWRDGAISKINQQLKDSNNDYNTKIEEARVANGLVTIKGTYDITDHVSFYKETILANIASIPRFTLQKIFVVYLEDMGAIIKGKVYNKQTTKSGPVNIAFELKNLKESIEAPVYYNANFLNIPTTQTDMGHGIAEQTQDLRAQLKIIEAAKEDTKDQDLKDFYEDCKRILIPVLTSMEAIDKLQIETLASINSGANLNGQLSNLMLFSSLVGVDEIVIVNTTGVGSVSGKIQKLPVDVSVNLLFPEAAKPNSWKGNKQLQLKDLWRQFLEKALTEEEFWIAWGNLTRSTSFFMASLLRALTIVFNDKSFENNIVKAKRKVVAQVIKAKKGNDKLSTDKILKKFAKHNSRIQEAIKQLHKGPKNFKNKTFRGPSMVSQEPTQNIVALINADLKRYLLAEMTQGNALRNRTGKFADSVKVLSAEEEAAVQYTYQAYPYSIFEGAPVGRRDPRTGKKARPAPFYLDRRPSEIIDKAIKRIGTDRFQQVFRTQKV